MTLIQTRNVGLEAMDKVFKSSDATRDAAMMHRIVQRLESEQQLSETASEKKSEYREVEKV